MTQLEILSLYLPYGVMCEVEKEDEMVKSELTGVDLDGSVYLSCELMKFKSEDVKLVLKPLSLFRSKDTDEFKRLEGNWQLVNPIQRIALEMSTINREPFEAILHAIKNHIDIFSLIPEGRAIKYEQNEP